MAPQAAKSSYTVKLEKYDDAKKVALIKEVKSLLEDMNLVQVMHTIFHSKLQHESSFVIVIVIVGQEIHRKCSSCCES